MWNNTRLLNLLANLMFGLATLIIAKLLVLACLNSPRFPLRTVRVSGELTLVSRDQLADAFAGRSIGNFFAADLSAVRVWVEGVPWVRRATVRRVWPDRLDVRIETQRALARWSERELVNTFGELFTAETREVLPSFSGPQGTEADIAERYRRFSTLLAPIEQQPAAVTLTPRFAWEITLNDGITIALGRDGPKESADDRLLRFVRVYPGTLARFSQRIHYVDMRYPNGFALRVPDLPALLKEGGEQSPENAPEHSASPQKISKLMSKKG